jgi:hypothetical protein
MSNDFSFDPNRGNQQQRGGEKAIGFVNVSLPREDGKRATVGGIPIVVSKAVHKMLIEASGAMSPEDFNAYLQEKAIIEYNAADGSSSAGLDFGDFPVAAAG